MAGIVPKRKVKGVDICGSRYNYFIIRSDLGCYMRSSDFKQGSDISIYALHPSCQYGDHYFGDYNWFYIIKGDDCRRVTDLTADSDSSVFTLHPNCRGGDHYLSGFGWFYIIFQDKGIYRRTDDLTNDYNSTEFPLHPNCKDGLYYWGLPFHYYFLKPTSKWAVEYYKGNDFEKDSCVAVYSVHPDVLNFLPGGLSITIGPAFGRWVNIRYANNDTPSTMIWKRTVTKKVGYNKEKMSQMTHNWNISASTTISSGGLEGLISQRQFSLTAEYGGSSVNAEKENWNEETTVEEEITCELKPNESLYVWQYQLGFGSEPVLFCKDLKVTNKPDPPTEVPLPPA
ncbi:hypothetical protein R3I94_013203 [Phoxinus phoxinus]